MRSSSRVCVTAGAEPRLGGEPGAAATKELLWHCATANGAEKPHENSRAVETNLSACTLQIYAQPLKIESVRTAHRKYRVPLLAGHSFDLSSSTIRQPLL